MNTPPSFLRRGLRPLIAAFVLLLVKAAAAQDPEKRAGAGLSEPPNIVVILADDMAWTDYGFLGAKDFTTPFLDRLAAESRQFTRGYVPSSLCGPSLAAFITGQYAHHSGLTSNDPPNPENLKPRDFYRSEAYAAGREAMARRLDAAPSMPRILRDAGYLTLQTGKWWLGDYKRGGFTDGMTSGQRHGDSGLAIGRETMQPIFDFIGKARKAKKPFFVWYAPMLPHSPHNPPPRLLQKHRRAGVSAHVAAYRAMVEWFDETCGELLLHLKEKDLEKNTIVVFLCDNGWIQDPLSPGYAPRSKQSPYDTGLRTPILLRWPGVISAGAVDTPVSSVDVLPTLLNLTGIPAPKEMDGIDLLDESAIQSRAFVPGACFTHDETDPTNPAASLRWRWLVRWPYKLIVPNPANEPNQKPELYQIEKDPMESQDLARKPEEEARVRELLELLNGWWNPESA